MIKLPSTLAHSAHRVNSFNTTTLSRLEGRRFHVFAGDYSLDDEWTNEHTAYQQKITINDTLQKENAIRKLAEEAEEEACLENDAGSDDETEISENDEELHDPYAFSDDGNESDDEQGFAESEDESEDDFDYQFWTPGLTTAATSTDHLEHIQPLTERVPSD